MSTSFSIGYEWLPSEHGDIADQTTLAELTINVGQWCATEVEDIFAKTVRSSARLSAYKLAEWFTSNWWRLLWEPKADTYSWRASHKIGNAGGGYVWPDLSFSSDWQSVLVSTRPTARWEAEPIRYLNQFDLPISIVDFERGVDDFINRTIARLSSVKNSQSDLSVLWSDVVSERDDATIAGRRILEACMGYDPDEAPDGLLDGLLEYMSSCGAGAIREIAAEHKDKTISHVNDIWEDAQKNDMVVDVPNCDSIRQRLASESSDSDIPWKHATHAAKIVRESWSLTAPISTDSLCNLLSIQTSRFVTGQNNDRRQLTAGVRSTCVPNKFHISLNSKYVTSRRFGLARLVADHIVTGQEEVLLPVTRSITSRQRFQRAFAQEFLCPFDDLKEYFSAEVPSSDDVYDAARYFDVSPLTIQTTLVNKGVFGQEALEDWVG